MLFPWNARVCGSVCSQWLLLTWFDNSSEHRVSGAAELKFSSRVWKGVRIRCAPDCMDDWQRSLQLFRQMLWMWNLRDSKFETQKDRTIAGYTTVIFNVFLWSKCLFSQGNRWISDSKDDRLICAPICTISQVHFELQGVASGISYLVSRALWNIHAHVSDIQDPVAMLNKSEQAS